MISVGEMLIHFNEHVGESYIEGCVDEIEEMGASIEPQDKLTFSVVVLKPKNHPFVLEFLQNEERAGNLRLENVELT